jgi:hypothetical protein
VEGRFVSLVDCKVAKEGPNKFNDSIAFLTLFWSTMGRMAMVMFFENQIFQKLKQNVSEKSNNNNHHKCT